MNSNDKTKKNKEKSLDKEIKMQKKDKKIRIIKKTLFYIIFITIISVINYNVYDYIYTNGNPIAKMKYTNIAKDYVKDKYKDKKMVIKQVVYNSIEKGFSAVVEDDTNIDKTQQPITFTMNMRDNKVLIDNYKDRQMSAIMSKQISEDVQNVKLKLVLSYINVTFLTDVSKIEDITKAENIDYGVDFRFLEQPSSQKGDFKTNMATDIESINAKLKDTKEYKNIQYVSFSYIDNINYKAYNILIEKKNIDLTSSDILSKNLITVTDLPRK